MIKLYEVHKSARNFSHGLDLSQRMQKRASLQLVRINKSMHDRLFHRYSRIPEIPLSMQTFHQNSRKPWTLSVKYSLSPHSLHWQAMLFSPQASDVSNLRWRARFCVNIVVNLCCMKYLFRKYISFLTRHLLSCLRIFPLVRPKKWSACMSWENIYEKHLASTTLSQDMLQQLLSSIWWCLSNPFKAARRRDGNAA